MIGADQMSLTTPASSPVAVVGVGLRFPGGVRSLPDYGRLLAAGVPAVSPVPPERWGPERCGEGPGRTVHHVGGFLEDVDRFDAAYFGIPPREADLLDPQHRMFLEVAWEAMSDSGRQKEEWRGSRTAVVVGMLANDYAHLHARTLGIDAVGPHHITGLEFSFAAGRLAYAFDLHGPVQAVNSACSSSLLAVHQAVQQLRAGECDTAVAGGVSLLLTPDNSIFLSSVGAMSPTGRCRPFDAAADGIVRGEGCGVVVLRRLEDALAEGDRIHAVVRGSAVNNDGSSLGLTVPNGQAQADLMRDALRRAGLRAEDVDYVEAHGTGTPLGDLIELDALGSVYGTARTADRPVHVGSHKALLGHMDAAAGMGGLLKAVWVAGTRTIPAQPSVSTPNPAVDWRDGALAVPLAPVRTDPDRPTRAAVSAYGLSGTNVHVLVESPPRPKPQDTPVPRPYVLLASGVDAPRLAGQLAELRERVADAGARMGDLVASAAARRTHEAHRCAVVADDRAALLAALARPDELPDGAYTGVAADPQDVPGPVFVFAGQGGQWPGMARDLYDADVQVRDALDECAELIRAEADWSLLDELRRAPDDAPDRFDRIQPAIFAVQVALHRWLAHRGVRPAAVIGHSLGEVAAAHAAGALDLADATRVIVRRSEILAGFAGAGRMLAVQTGAREAGSVLGALPVDVVAVNGPGSVVVAGTPEAVEDAVALLDASGIRSRLLRVDAAAHSGLVAEGGPLLERAVAGIAPRPAAVRLMSTVDPAATGLRFDAAYWARNFTSPVRLWPAVDLLLSEDDHPLVEIGPHPVLLSPLTDARRARRRHAPVLGLLDRQLPGPTTLARALARLHVAGVHVDWTAAVGRPRRYHDLPVPSWRDSRHWLPGVPPGRQTSANTAPARVRVSVLDAAGRVTEEWFAGDGQAPSANGETGTASATAPAVSAAGESRHGSDRQSPPAPSPTPAPAAPGSPELPGATGTPLAALVDLIDSEVRGLLELSADDPPLGRRRGLFEQGLDSLRAVALRRRLQERFTTELSTGIVIERPTIRALAEHLVETVPAADLARGLGDAPDDSGATPPTPGAAQGGAPVGAAPRSDRLRTPPPASATTDEPVAVVGIACRLPGADSPDAFWRLLVEGTRTTSVVPPGRRDDPLWRRSRAGIPELGSHLGDVAGFDAPFFRVSPREAKVLDPQHRLFLEVAWEALEDAGSPALSLTGRPVGVYVGAGASDYQHLVARGMGDEQEVPLSLHHGTGTSAATLAGRLSYLLGLSGPSLAVDTACSSSLTAVHLACQALRTGDCEVAVAGGVSVLVAPTPLMASMAASGALAADGRCKTFDEDADGFGIGEGAGVVVLKPLAAARRDGDRVYAVLRAGAVNQDGATGGMTVPNGGAQAELVRTALRKAGWQPGDVDYVEAHGTGTPLGDPVEVRALADALGAGRPAHTPLLVGSAKANIGHLGAAAGVVGLLKVVLALRAGQLPPHPLERPSSRIEWDRLPVVPVRELREWPRGADKARAGVSAFGFSGTNVHLLVEQAPPYAAAASDAGGPYVLPVSAATPSALRVVAARTAGFLRTGHRHVADVVLTATYRRSLLEHRAVVVGADAADLALQLLRVGGRVR
ncbi:beta-ketoacyl synthase N-terminal-like domain-containing protein, partial [Streptomyces sp. NPDC047072]|uniref:beta-ketoacyl synthase N-terminal-like domain-containing protein n=1 Tax=Streptomyces sp. NPDC047072 TaxID=3154809 RepID=UPI0033CA7FCC